MPCAARVAGAGPQARGRSGSLLRFAARYPRRVLPDKRTPTPPPRKATRKPRRSALPPGAAFLLLPFSVFLAAVLLGAVHRWLGEPLGARFASEVWDLSRNLGIMMLTGAPFVAMVSRVNANALAASKNAALQSPAADADDASGVEEFDHGHDDNGPARSRRR